jgi:alkylation response protein AidB-like acyl-CoA dehydrogenase
MSTDYSEFHAELRAVAQQLLEARRADDGSTFIEWQPLVDAGWTGLEVPEALGGAGATFAETAVVIEELGRAVAQSAFVGSTVLGTGALLLLEPSPERDRLLAGAAAGSHRVAVAVPMEDQDAADTPFVLERSGDRWRLTGHAPFVLDADAADRLLIVARSGDTVVVAAVDPRQSAITVGPRPLVDPTRRLSSLTAEGAEVEHEWIWRFASDGDECCRRLRDRGAMAMAADSLGLARAMLDATVAYASVRQQFGRPIGSFQAVQHACADMQVQVSMSRELLVRGVQGLAADDDEGWVAVSMAKSHICGAAVDVAGKAMQLHGGIGYTWESGIHAFLKRAALNRTLFGSPRWHRGRLGRRYLTAGAGAPAE